MQRFLTITACAVFVILTITITSNSGGREVAPPASQAGQDAKAYLTDAQKKIGSQMLHSMGASGDTEREVSVRAAVSDDLETAITELGGSVLASYPKYGAIEAVLPLASLEVLAERDDVYAIRAPD